MPIKPTISKPRLRAPDGSFSARGVLNGKLLRKVWSSPPAQLLPSAVDQFSVVSVGQVLEFADVFTADKVDNVNAIIRGVSVITSGVTARGHDLEVDDITLAQMKSCAEEKGNQVPVKVDHKSGAAAVCGFLTNFTLEGNKLKADWHLLKTHPQKDQILEVAERMPKGVGLSASFIAPKKPEKTATGKPAARCEELISVDYVTLPAANPNGMFEAKVDSLNNSNSQPMNITPEIQAAIDAAVQAATAPLTEQINSLHSQQNLMANPPSLEEAAEMTDEQLAEVGLTRDEVNEAVEAHNAEAAEAAEGEDSEDSECEATEGVAADVGLNAALTEIRNFSAQIKFAKAAQAQAEHDAAYESIETKFDALLEQNIHLQEQLLTGGKAASHGATVGFKAKSGVTINFAVKELGQFEEAVLSHLDEFPKASQAAAFSAVIKSSPELYLDYKARRGLVKSA